MVKATKFQIDSAIASVSLHPTHKEAIAWPYSVLDVLVEPKSFVFRLPVSDSDRARIAKALEDVESVLWVSYSTAQIETQPLSGGGREYGFFVHPTSFSVLHFYVGTWRA